MLEENKSDKLIPRKTVVSFILITSLFALWGVANSVTDPMVQAFKKVLELSNSEAAWVQMAFYGGYFCMALPAALFVRKFSYKTGILIGLGLYAAGALLFYPAAIYEKFWFFCVGLYILTFGLAFLETTANPYILSMGSPRTSTQRLNFAQAFNPVGLLAGLIIAKFFVLNKLQSNNLNSFSALSEAEKEVIRSSDLLTIRYPYVVLGTVVLMIFFLILFTKMPQAQSEGELPPLKKTFWGLFNRKRYKLGVLSQMFYVGVQIMCWTYIYQYAESIGISSSTAANYQIAAFVLFAIGRGIGTWMLRIISPGKLLWISALLGGIACLGVIFINGILGLNLLVLISLFLSVMFPTIYGIALEELSEDDSKIGAAGLVMAIVGGALMPKLQGMIIDIGGYSVKDIKILGVPEVNLSFLLPFICLVVIFLYGRFSAGLELNDK